MKDVENGRKTQEVSPSLHSDILLEIFVGVNCTSSDVSTLHVVPIGQVLLIIVKEEFGFQVVYN